MRLKSDELKVGTSLPELKREVKQENVNLYASASGDFNPIHIDPEFAKRAGLEGTIAHGMLILAYISEFMTRSFGQDWLTGGRLSARFKAPARPGDTITVSGKVTAAREEERAIAVNCDVLCRNQRDEPVIVCETKVRVNADENSH
jgi:3-hydroxybutyryl-CoA dehydratase